MLAAGCDEVRWRRWGLHLSGGSADLLLGVGVVVGNGASVPTYLPVEVGEGRALLGWVTALCTHAVASPMRKLVGGVRGWELAVVCCSESHAEVVVGDPGLGACCCML